MSSKPVNLIVATDKNYGYYKNGKHPWKLESDFKFFAKITKYTKDSNKTNAVIMDNDVWNHIRIRPLPNRKNVLITNNQIQKDSIPGEVMISDNIDNAIKNMKNDDTIEKIWIIGGMSIFKEAIVHPTSCRIYLTEIQYNFDCDTIFPEFKNHFRLLSVHGEESQMVPIGEQEENGLKYFFRIYEKTN